MSDSVRHPSHYNQGKIEVLEFIEDQKLNFSRGSCIKYICRAGKKKSAGISDLEKEAEDLSKAAFYLNREIELVRAALELRDPKRPNEMDPNWKLAVKVPFDPRAILGGDYKVTGKIEGLRPEGQ